MPIRQFKPVTKGTRFRSVSDFSEITRDDAGEVAARAAQEERRPRQPRPHLDAPPRRRAQAAVPHHRLQAQQARHARHGRDDRVRSEPFGAHRAGAVRGRREALHPAPEGAERSATRSSSGPGSDIRIGNALPLAEIPLGTAVHNIELKIGKGAQICRSAGMSAQVVAKEGEYVTLRMPSTEMRLVHARCLATIGEVGNAEHELESWGKAGKTRWKGRRPKVRGEVMNPVDHPHGGRTRGGRNVVSPWGKKEGVKTRNKKKASQRMIVRGRKRGKATQ